MSYKGEQMQHKGVMILGDPLDQPERLVCFCNCDYFKINLEAPYDGTSSSIINSVECERCHAIYALSVMVTEEGHRMTCIEETTKRDATLVISEMGNSLEVFEQWFDKYAYENRIALDTRMIHFAEEVWMATLEEIKKRIQD